MNSILKAYVWATLWKDESGQDLIEYALVVALIAFAAVVGMNTVANGINSAFLSISTALSSAMASAS